MSKQVFTEHDVSTGIEIQRDMTPEEIAELKTGLLEDEE